ncbi:MAG TPA: hypothetical protein VFV73_40075 [Streptosporangiaceae bacterium]|nr:hypothetical protein [Streptosporangiaceae bacterium]
MARRWHTGERKLAAGLLPHLREGMLLLADRGFYSFGLRTAAAGTGAALLWRAEAGLRLPVVTALPDGSWLTRIPGPAAVRRRVHRNGARRRGSRPGPDTGPLPGITVRVTEFWLLGPPACPVTVGTGDAFPWGARAPAQGDAPGGAVTLFATGPRVY